MYLPKATAEILRAKRLGTSIPVSRLVAIALDNELDSTIPFNYPCELPERVTEYLYAAEAGRLLAFLTRAPTGVARDTIMLCRRDIGVMDRDALMGAMKELLDKNLIEEFDFKGKIRVRARGIDKKLINKRRFNRIEDEKLKGKRVITDEDVS